MSDIELEVKDSAENVENSQEEAQEDSAVENATAEENPDVPDIVVSVEEQDESSDKSEYHSVKSSLDDDLQHRDEGIVASAVQFATKTLNWLRPGPSQEESDDFIPTTRTRSATATTSPSMQTSASRVLQDAANVGSAIKSVFQKAFVPNIVEIPAVDEPLKEEEEVPEVQVSRTWAELLNSDWWDPSEGRTLSATERVVHAAMFIEDSLVGDPVIERANWMRKIHRFRSSYIWAYLVWILVILQCSLAWLEPPSTLRAMVDPIVVILDLVCVCVEWIDIVLLYASIGPSFFRNKWHVAQLIVNVILLSDVVWAFAMPIMRFRYSRIFRPVQLLSRSKLLRDSLTAMVQTVKTLVQIALSLLAVILGFAIIGTHLWSGAYPIPPVGLNRDGSFENLLDSALSLFVLLTTANYPFVALPAVKATGEWSWIFFSLFLLLAFFLFLSLYLAAVFGSYKRLRSQRVIQERMRERRALSASFQYLDFEGENKLNFDVVVELLRYLKPGISDWEAEMRFCCMDIDGDGQLDCCEYFCLIDALLLNIEDINHYTKEAPRWQRYIRMVALLLTIVQMVVHCTFNFTSGEPLFYVTAGCVIAYTCEILFRIIVGRREFWSKPWNIFELIVIGIGIAGHVLIIVLYPVAPAVNDPSLIIRVANVCRVAPVLRIVTLFMPLQLALSRLLRILPALAPVLLAILTISYAYAIIGMEIMAPYPAFGSATQSILTLFQMLSLASWHLPMYDAIDKFGMPITLFFLIFVIFAVFLCVNVAIAAVMESYLVEMDRKGTRERLEVDWSEEEAATRRMSTTNVPEEFDTLKQESRHVVIRKSNRAWERDVADVDMLMQLSEEEASQLSMLLRMPNLIDLKRSKDEIMWNRRSSTDKENLSHLLQNLLFASDIDPVHVKRIEQMLKDKGLLELHGGLAFDTDLFKATTMKIFGARRAKAERDGEPQDVIVRETRLRGGTVVRAVVSEDKEN